MSHCHSLPVALSLIRNIYPLVSSTDTARIGICSCIFSVAGLSWSLQQYSSRSTVLAFIRTNSTMFIEYTTTFNHAFLHQQQQSNVSTAWSTVKANIAYRTAISWINSGKVAGTKVPGSESSQELSFSGAKGLAISLRGAKVPGNERARERMGQGPTGRFAAGSELARERKGRESKT